MCNNVSFYVTGWDVVKDVIKNVVMFVRMRHIIQLANQEQVRGSCVFFESLEAVGSSERNTPLIQRLRSAGRKHTIRVLLPDWAYY